MGIDNPYLITPHNKAKTIKLTVEEHYLLFDLHGEYNTAFPYANYLDVDNLLLPYWLMNGEELEELFVESGESQAYNQVSLLRRIVTRNKQHINGDDKILFDSPVKFSVSEVLNCIINLSKETRNSKDSSDITIKDNKKRPWSSFRPPFGGLKIVYLQSLSWINFLML